MYIEVAEAIAAVRRNLDEVALNNSAMFGEDTDNSVLDTIIEETLPLAIEAVHLEADASLLEGFLLTEKNLANLSSTKNGALDMKFLNWDILRLISFKAGDSPVLVGDACYENSPLARMQDNRFVMGQPDSPVLVEMSDSADHHPHYKYYSTNLSRGEEGKSDDLAFQFRYFPFPIANVVDPEVLGRTVLTFTPSSLSFGATTGLTLSLTIVADGGWQIVDYPRSWLTIDEEDRKGTTGSTQISLTALANTTNNSRNGYIIFSNGSVVSLSQASQGYIGDDVLTISPSSVSWGFAGGARTIGLTTAYAWSVASAPDWISISPTSGEGSSTVVLTAQPGIGQPRSGAVVFSCNGETFSLPVSEEGAPMLSCIPSSMSISPNRAVSGGAVAFRLNYANPIDDDEIVVLNESSLPSWVTLYFNEDLTATLEVQPNYSLSSRTVTVNFGSTEMPSLQTSFTLTQNGVQIDIPATAQFPSDAASSMEVSVQANCQWVLISGNSWMTFSGGSDRVQGTGNMSVPVYASANSGGERSTSLTLQFSDAVGSQTVISKTCTVTQPGDAAFYVAPTSFDLNADNHQENITIRSDENWRIESD